MQKDTLLRSRRKRLSLTQQRAADRAHMPVLIVVLLENPAKLDEYRDRLAASYDAAEKALLAELQQAA